MGLLNLISDPKNFVLGIEDSNGVRSNVNIAYGGPSKFIKYGSRKGENPAPTYHLVDRVEWYGTNAGTNEDFPYSSDPTFLIGKDHTSNYPDYVFRGGENAFEDRRNIDYRRIENFLYDSDGVGTQFLIRQGVLQSMNPTENTRTFNAGVSLLAQIAASGLSNIKRHGLIPEPAGININAGITGWMQGNIVGNFISNLFGGGYLDLDKFNNHDDDYEKSHLRFKKGYGDPGRPKYNTWLGKAIDTLIDNPFRAPQSGELSKKEAKFQSKYVKRLDKDLYTNAGVDLVNFAGVKWTGTQKYKEENKNSDFIDFIFAPIDQTSSGVEKLMEIRFRAFLDSFTDDFNATHNAVKYNGRGEKFYTYQEFNRKINLSFKIAAQSVHEMKPLYQKLNYLAAQTAPGYFGNRMITPYMRLTIGDYLYKVPGILNNLNLSWNKEYPWEINKEQSRWLKKLPQILDVSCNFTPIHDFTPNSGYRSAPFLSIGSVSKNPSQGHGIESENWLQYDPRDGDYVDKYGFGLEDYYEYGETGEVEKGYIVDWSKGRAKLTHVPGMTPDNQADVKF
tara:strand:- start:6973 stop:8655 length:1683 start_codon:yes stop_codon:yes gene_type:complete